MTITCPLCKGRFVPDDEVWYGPTESELLAAETDRARHEAKLNRKLITLEEMEALAAELDDRLWTRAYNDRALRHSG